MGKTIFLTYMSQHCRKRLYTQNTVRKMSMKVYGLSWLILGFWPNWVPFILQRCKDHCCDPSMHLCIQHIQKWVLTQRINLTYMFPNLWESTRCLPFQSKSWKITLKLRRHGILMTTSSSLYSPRLPHKPFFLSWLALTILCICVGASTFSRTVTEIFCSEVT